MGLLKDYCNIKANSLLESVVALSIISVCLYIAVMIYSAVFTSKTSLKFYSSKNKIYEAFFMAQLQQDSIFEEKGQQNYYIETEIVNSNLNKTIIKYRDSVQDYPEQFFYISNE